jgi:hypothetical protein
MNGLLAMGKSSTIGQQIIAKTPGYEPQQSELADTSICSTINTS